MSQPSFPSHAYSGVQQVEQGDGLEARLALVLSKVLALCSGCCLRGPSGVSVAAGKVRKECVEGLRRVIGLRRVEWARQVSSLNLLPSSSMLTLLDKKFGGELTKEDVQVGPWHCRL